MFSIVVIVVHDDDDDDFMELVVVLSYCNRTRAECRATSALAAHATACLIIIAIIRPTYIISNEKKNFYNKNCTLFKFL